MDPRHLAHSSPFRFGLLLALIGLTVGLALAAAWPKSTSVSLAFTVDQRKRQATAEYAYDGYYALKAAELFTDTVISWFGTPSVVAEIYQKAGVPLPNGDASAATANFRMKRLSSQVVTARFKATDENTGQSLARAAAEVVAERAARLGVDERGNSLFIVQADQPDIAVTKPSLPAAGVAGVVLGLLAAYSLWFAGEKKE